MDPNVVDDKMKSPMRMAAKFGHSVVVQYLMNFGGASEVKVGIYNLLLFCTTII